MLNSQERIVLKRDCESIQVPYGTTLELREGMVVFLMQKLGDTFTVRTESGYLVRINNQDADALGYEPVTTPAILAKRDNIQGDLDDNLLWEQLKTCYDPEIPANIVDLGLIYEVVSEKLDDNTYKIYVKMTLTAPGCGMGQVLHDDVERKLLEVPGVKTVTVDLVFDPPWDRDMMSEAARLQLGMY